MLYSQQYRDRVSSNPDKEIKKSDSLSINWRELSSNPNALKKYQDNLPKS